MRKFLAASIVALTLSVGLAAPAPAAASAAAAMYAVTNDGILQYTYYFDPYARAWILIRVELYFPD